MPLVCHELAYKSLAVHSVLPIKGAKVMECGHVDTSIQRKNIQCLSLLAEEKKMSCKTTSIGYVFRKIMEMFLVIRKKLKKIKLTKCQVNYFIHHEFLSLKMPTCH